MSKLSCRDFLSPVLKQHLDLAIELINMVKSRNTGDPTYRFQAVGIIMFLAGVDKVLSLACKLLCVAGVIDRNWLANQKHYRGGVLICTRGLTARINKLLDLGVFGTDRLIWLVELRNDYLHSQEVTAGYGIEVDNNGNLVLKASGPQITFSSEPLTAVDSRVLQSWSDKFVNDIAIYLDEKTDFWARWDGIRKYLISLPENPEPEFSTIQQCEDAEGMVDIVEQLNRKVLGQQWQSLLQR